MARARTKAFVPRAPCSRLAAPPSRATMPSQSWVKSDSRVIPCWNHTRFLDARALLAPMGAEPGSVSGAGASPASKLPAPKLHEQQETRAPQADQRRRRRLRDRQSWRRQALHGEVEVEAGIRIAPIDGVGGGKGERKSQPSWVVDRRHAFEI